MQILSSFGTEGLKLGLDLVKGNVESLKKVEGYSCLILVGIIFLLKTSCLDGIKTSVDFFVTVIHFMLSQTIIYSQHVSIQKFFLQLLQIEMSLRSIPSRKSQKNGLKIIDTFCLWDGKC